MSPEPAESTTPKKSGTGLNLAVLLVTSGLILGAALYWRRGETKEIAPRPTVSEKPAAARSQAPFRLTLADPLLWVKTSEADFQERSVDFLPVSGSTPPLRRLRLRAATIGTRDDTVKFLGARSAEPIPLGKGGKVSVDVDWNHQANGCYLAAQIVLAPAKTEGNPLGGADWLKVEYLGVPPGTNGRLAVGTRTSGRDGPLFTEGWPQVRREGRPIGLQHVDIEIKDRGFVVRENGVESYVSKPDEAPAMQEAYLYLQMSTHSNYPARELYFGRVEYVPAD
jgi:hypothetical protein